MKRHAWPFFVATAICRFTTCTCTSGQHIHAHHHFLSLSHDLCRLDWDRLVSKTVWLPTFTIWPHDDLPIADRQVQLLLPAEAGLEFLDEVH